MDSEAHASKAIRFESKNPYDLQWEGTNIKAKEVKQAENSFGSTKDLRKQKKSWATK